jgi:hypothetical protein
LPLFELLLFDELDEFELLFDELLQAATAKTSRIKASSEFRFFIRAPGAEAAGNLADQRIKIKPIGCVKQNDPVTLRQGFAFAKWREPYAGVSTFRAPGPDPNIPF